MCTSHYLFTCVWRVQKYVFISVDIFREKLHNKGVDTENKLEAWLIFLGEDDPERIMGIFSKELAELDKNTVQYMIDEMQDTIDAQREQLSQKDEQLSQKKEQLSKMGEMIEEMKQQMEALQKQVQAQK